MHHPLRSAASLCLLVLLLAGARLFGALDVGDRKQLFLDHRFVEQATGIEWRMHPPQKGEIALTGEHSWEDGLISDAAAIVEDGGKFRMWYTACPASGPELAVFKLCYAESLDGVHWVKPNLGLFEWKGSRANNIIMDSNIENGGGVFLDPSAPPPERYKLLARLSARRVLARGRDPEVNNAPNGPGLYLYTSPDGLKWTLRPTRVFPFSPDTVNMALYDGSTRMYLAYVRTWNPLRRVGVVEMKDILQPWPYAKVPPRLWPNRPQDNPAPSREVPEAFGPEAGDPDNVDFYTSAVVKYPWADDVFVMFPSAYRHFPDPPVGKFRNDGLVDIQFAAGRDGRKFHQPSRSPYVELGERGAVDSGSMYMCIGMIRRRDVIFQYYGGNDFSHGSYAGLTEIRHRGALRVLRQRLDGFVSLAASEKGGEFVTPILKFSGNRLELNLDASATGTVEVELRDQAGQPIAGHSFSEADTLGGNDLAKVVTWRDASDLSAFAGQPVRLAIRLRNAHLYAFQFTD